MKAKSQWYLLGMILAGLSPVLAEITVPVLPGTNLEKPDSAFWLQQENWPEKLNNMNVEYRLIVEVSDGGKSQMLDSFRDITGDEDKITAFYSPNLEQLNNVEVYNEGHMMYGPHFSWMSGKLRMKGFSFETGDWIHKHFDQDGRIWMKSISIRHGNEGFMKLYDQQGNLVAYLRGPDDYDQEYEGKIYSTVKGKEVSDDEFFKFVSQFMTNRLEKSKAENE